MDVDRIVAGLSRAQREAIRVADANGALSCRGNYWRAARGLHKKGLATQPITPSRLTPLGLQVRARLTQETDHG